MRHFRGQVKKIVCDKASEKNCMWPSEKNCMCKGITKALLTKLRLFPALR